MKSTKFSKYPGQLVIISAMIIFWSPGFSQVSRMLPKDPVFASSYVQEDQQIIPMSLAERIKRGVIPDRGLCSISPGAVDIDFLMSGNGKMRIKVSGNPLSEKVVFIHERLLVPWKMPFEAPKIAYILPEVRKLIMKNEFDSAVNLSFDAARNAGMPPGTMNHGVINAFTMKFDQLKAGPIRNYLRTVDFESGEIKVLWEDQKGQWERKTFVSRPDNIVVQLLNPPQGQLLSTKIILDTFIPYTKSYWVNPDMDPSLMTYNRDFNEKRLIVECHFDPRTGNIGYAGAVRVVLNGGKATIKDGVLVVEGAKSLLLMTCIEWYKDFQKSKVEELVDNLNNISPDYQKLLARNPSFADWRA